MFGARMQNNPISNEEGWEILNANATPENKAQLNAAVPPNPSSETPTRNAVFGGQSSGFAAGVADRLSRSFYSEGAAASAETVAKGMGDNEIPRSIANKYALFNFQGFNGNLSTNQKDNYRDVPNNPLMGGDRAHNVTIPKVLEYFATTYPKISYQASDFLYSKYYKKIPVNHLVTLRRFPTPIQDNIYNLGVRIAPSTKEENGTDNNIEAEERVDATQVAGVTAVTYMGETAGNKLDDLLKMSFGLKYKQLTGEMESIDTGDQGGGYTKQPFYNKIGSVGRAITDVSKGQTAGSKFRAQNGTGSSTADRLNTTYPNFVLGPVNVVNETQIRDMGLKFTNDIKLSFEYELRSLSFVNPKVAMIDVISNMLTMTTNNAQFFGGGHRYYGSAGFVASAFGNPSLLKAGDFSGYMGSIAKDVNKGVSNVFGDADGGFSAESIVKGGLKAGKQMLGNALGKMLKDMMGSTGGTQATKAFISGEPTGDWHLTIGNPLNPIAMMGNMICDNSTMTLGKGLGYDDFPMEVKFEIDLKHGKPRDKGDIENMFNAGQGRIYASARGEEDILNLAGVEVETYGSIQTGTTSTSPSQSAATNGAPASSVGNANVNTSPSNGSDGGIDPQLISNVTSMMING
tara:strand:+ start:2602 stop:4491 length:1890 start_codon:yes stop_codon:yes gene_type:complete